jgi:hypothetical protein
MSNTKPHKVKYCTKRMKYTFQYGQNSITIMHPLDKYQEWFPTWKKKQQQQKIINIAAHIRKVFKLLFFLPSQNAERQVTFMQTKSPIKPQRNTKKSLNKLKWKLAEPNRTLNANKVHCKTDYFRKNVHHLIARNPETYRVIVVWLAHFLVGIIF